jgi:dihydrofolate reductase
MRKVVAALFYSLDGITQAPQAWQEIFDEDMDAELETSLPTSDTILMGRVTYQEWKEFWPPMPDDSPMGGYPKFINHTPKYVVSTTLESVEWGTFETIKLIKSNVAEEIGKLKRQPGKNISVQGSPGLVNSLLQQELLDELTLCIHNVVAYSGKPLFSTGALKRLDLVEAKPTRSGVIIAKYQPRKS